MSSRAGSARQVTGVGPRHAFIIDDLGPAGAANVDNIIGVDVTCTRGGDGEYIISHSLGHTGYVISVTAEMADEQEAICNAKTRSGTTFGIEVYTDGGAPQDAVQIHGIIYD